MYSFLNSKEGFTLIELLIVVAVLGMLVAVVVPNVGDIRQKASITAVSSSLKNVTTQIESDILDEDNTINDYNDFVTGDFGDDINYTSNTEGDDYIIYSDEIGGNYYYIQNSQINNGIQTDTTEPTL